MLVSTTLTMGGYSGESVPAMQKRMIDALETIPGVQSVGSVDRPPLHYGANDSVVYREKTTDLKPSNAAAEPRDVSDIARILRCRGDDDAGGQELHLA